MTVRFIHSADWQLGMTRHFLAEEAQAALRAGADRRASGRSGGLAQRRRLRPSSSCRATSSRRTGSSRGRCAGRWRRWARSRSPCSCSRATTTRSTRRPSTARRPSSNEPAANVTVLDDADAATTSCPGVEVVGAPWMSKRPLARPRRGSACAALEPSPGLDRVSVVAHGATDDLIDFDEPGRDPRRRQRRRPSPTGASPTWRWATVTRRPSSAPPAGSGTPARRSPPTTTSSTRATCSLVEIGDDPDPAP